MKEHNTNKLSANIIYGLQAFVIQYALFTTFSVPRISEHYDAKINYYLAEAAELLGNYDFKTFLGFIIAFFFLKYMKEKKLDCIHKPKVLPYFFALCLLLGNSYADLGNADYCFGSIINFVKFLVAFMGYSILFDRCINLFVYGYDKVSNMQISVKYISSFFGKHVFRNVFLLLIFVWSPVIILSYPGNLCYDVIGQIYQGVGLSEYSAHHPLFNTLFICGIINTVKSITGSLNMGLFAYIWVQAIVLASALAGTIWFLHKKRVSGVLLTIITGIYVLSPVYSNVVSTALKDVPFMAAVIWYIILFAMVVEQKERLRNPKFAVLFIVLQVLVSLLRNNGFYMVFLTGIIVSIIGWKENNRAMNIAVVFTMILLPALIYMMSNNLLIAGLSAEKGSSREMFSVPFQQTARYLQLYQSEISEAERIGIEAVLGDVGTVAEKYNPDLADPVKALYKDGVGISELAQYFKAWFQGLIKHPKAYFDAFFVHVYGWFDPAVSNNIRYEAYDDLFPRQGLFPDANKVLIFVYRLLDRITPISMLQNAGVYTWGLFVLAGILIKKHSKKAVMLIPLFISLLICMVSPCFYLHLRYAFPIMFTLPFIYGYMSGNSEEI